MRIALIGATGFVGKAVLQELISRHHSVTAIQRSNKKIEEIGNYEIVSVDILQQTSIASILKGHDAVISSFNPGWDNANLYNDFLKGSKIIQQSVKDAGIKRFIVIGGAGSLYINPTLQLVDSDGFPDAWKSGALAARDYLNIIKEESMLDWTFLSPAIEMHQGTSGIRKGIYRVGYDNPVFDTEGRSVISVEDTAVAVVDELERPNFLQKRFTVGY